jgi:hypothetical protein
MRLDAVDDDDAVGIGSEPVHVHRRAVGERADDRGLHGCPDRNSGTAFGDAVTLEDLPLAFRGCRAVAAHRGEDERLGA